MELFTWCYNTWQLLASWGYSVVHFMSQSVLDLVVDGILDLSIGKATLLFQFGGNIASMRAHFATFIPDISVFELMFGTGTVILLGYILASWILDLIT